MKRNSYRIAEIDVMGYINSNIMDNLSEKERELQRKNK